MVNDTNVVAEFGQRRSAEGSRLKIATVAPKRPTVRRGRKIRLKVTARNIGDAAAANARICVRRKKFVAKAFKPLGKRCFGLGSLGAGTSRTRAFKLKARRRAKKGHRYRIDFVVSGKGTAAVRTAIKVKVR